MTKTIPVFLNQSKFFFRKPQNLILLIFGVVLSVTTIAPVVTILLDTVTVHPGTIDAMHGPTGFTVFNWKDIFTGSLAIRNFWSPLTNTLLLAIFSCIGAILIKD